MRTIKTIQDVRLIRAAKVLSDSFTSYLEEEFLGLKEAFDFDGLDEVSNSKSDLIGRRTNIETVPTYFSVKACRPRPHSDDFSDNNMESVCMRLLQ